MPSLPPGDVEAVHQAATGSRGAPRVNVNEVNASGRTPLHVAAALNHAEVVAQLLADGAGNITPFCSH